MPLITPSYFIADLNIPNAGTGGDVDRSLAWYIKEYEVKFLRLALGQSLYKAFMTGLGLQDDGSYTNVNADGSAKDTLDARWKDLLNGKDYTDVSTLQRHWPGLVALHDGSQINPRSPIANYVYFYFLRDQVQQTTTFGMVTATTENATAASPRPRLVRVWNKMGDWFSEFNHFLQNNLTVYPEWTEHDGRTALRAFGFENPEGSPTTGINPFF